MNKALVVGHPDSGFKIVEELLLNYGMSEALPAFSENLYPQDVDAMLCKAHGVVDLYSSDAEPQIEQLDVSQVWSGLVLDLMRGNLEQEFWGWSDPQAIYLLDYWHQLDTSIVFVLVYNHPRTALGISAKDEASQEYEIKQWCAYNEAILRFFHRHQQRCLLVHADQVQTSATSYLQQIETRLNTPLSLPEEVAVSASRSSGISTNSAEAVTTSDNVQGSDESELVVSSTLPVLTTDTDLGEYKSTPLAAYLATQILAQYPESLQLYEELQAVANLPCSEKTGSVSSPTQAWHTFESLLKQSLQANRLRASLQEEKDTIYADLQEKQENLRQNLIRIEELELQKKEETTQLSKENELLLQQLHQVQEELEKQYLEGKQKLQKLEEARKSDQEHEKQKQQLKAELDKTHTELKVKQKELNELRQQVGSDSGELKEENELLLQQLHQVQEELERYYLQNQELKANAKPVYYGAAERLKSELPYTLGAAIIERTRKVWPLPFLPLSMWRVTRKWNKEHKDDFFQEELPPLEEYSDYEKAQKAQQHLSYRLGVAWMKHIRTPWGWIIMPFALLNAHRRFRKYRRAQGK